MIRGVTFQKIVLPMPKPSLTRFGVSIDTDLLRRFDRHITHAGYNTRSEAFRDLVRARLVEEDVGNPDSPAFGVLTLVYNHHQRELEEKLTDTQHHHHHHIISTMHVHLDHDHCLEVILLRGDVRTIRSIAESLGSFKGVKHADLTLTTLPQFT
jgi:CopG family nickel-responsive transcriptional regulator